LAVASGGDKCSPSSRGGSEIEPGPDQLVLFLIPSDPDSVIRHRRDALMSTLKFVDFKQVRLKIEPGALL